MEAVNVHGYTDSTLERPHHLVYGGSGGCVVGAGESAVLGLGALT